MSFKNGRLIMSYEKCVRTLSNGDAKEAIFCVQTENIATLYKVFFDRAEGEVKILCNDLNRFIFCREDLLESLEKAINRGVNFKIVIKTQPAEYHDFLTKISYHQNWRPNQLRLYRAFESDKFKKIEKLEHTFCVVDEQSYRWSEREGKGVASMRDKKIAKSLSEMFDILVGKFEEEMQKVET